jgi:hypothetical protein
VDKLDASIAEGIPNLTAMSLPAVSSNVIRVAQFFMQHALCHLSTLHYFISAGFPVFLWIMCV